MTHDTPNNGNAPIIFDDWRTIAFAVILALVGYSVLVTVPVLSTALVHSLSYTAEQVGRVWGNDMLGFSVGAIVAALSVARVNRRHLSNGRHCVFHRCQCPVHVYSRLRIDDVASFRRWNW